jgi:hypothetical protein
MFDRAARAAWRVGAAPYVDIAVLTALATLLRDVTSVSGAPSQSQDSSAALGSHDERCASRFSEPLKRTQISVGNSAAVEVTDFYSVGCRFESCWDRQLFQ